MNLRSAHEISLLLAVFSFGGAALHSQQPAGAHPATGSHLQYVIYLSRHGVRSPTGKAAQYNSYSSSPWPEWSVPPGYLTPHGYQLMKNFGAFDRSHLADAGLLAPEGCADAANVTIVADSDQRTRETGKAIAEGMFPGCSIEVRAQPEGSNDPLFHPLETSAAHVDRATAVAAVSGRIGGDPANLAEVYRPQLTALDHILAGCGKVPATNAKRTSIFDVPASLGEGKKDHPVEMRGPISTASSLSENLLLEYTDGMTGTNLGWGCLDEPTLRNILDLHEAAAEFAQRTPAISPVYAANLLNAIVFSLEQSAGGKAMSGALGKPSDRVLFLAAHDTNITTVAGTLGLDWIVDGRRDDTPPGGALVFELWRGPGERSYSVRAYYIAQTLDQMRETRVLTAGNPPPRAQLFIPGCSEADQACTLSDFAATVRRTLTAR